MFKIRVVYDIGEGIESNLSGAEIGMPVFLCTTHIFTVVNMKDRNLIFTDQMIKLVDHTVEIAVEVEVVVVSSHLPPPECAGEAYYRNCPPMTRHSWLSRRRETPNSR